MISANGSRIACQALNGISRESFHTYLVTQALSFAMLKQGIEPLHATAVVLNDRTVAFLGGCGSGKSSLGAAFLQAGHTLLTDDLLVVQEADGRFVAHPGPPRIKLYPEIANAFLRERATGTPMNADTRKLVIPLGCRLSAKAATPLGAIYVLRPETRRPRGDRIAIRPLSPRRAVLELIANTFNAAITEPDRLARQFRLVTRLASGVPVRSLSYPRDLARLPAVLEAIRSDLSR
ncbi:MAG: hypothetical protein HY725_05075 [Candidatus Rokubacteria bacterium]|nr:hypothetical protein [Candidatus Rokubacteria bacterium]